MKRLRYIAIGLVVLAILLVAATYLRAHVPAVLAARGPVALQERNLMLLALLLMMIVVIPVYVLTATFAWKYRASNTKAKYSPHLEGSRLVETIWWLIPTALIAVLSMLAWTSSHQLDPYRPLASSQPSLTIQVVALDWKWLFLYPEQGVATVGYVEFPQNTPINFEITSDAPMNSFWIPQLAGQIYAMPGMSTELHLMATSTGSYYGESANISGAGFAGMHFTARATTAAGYAAWLAAAKHSSHYLNVSSYVQLARPSQNNPPATYALASANLYDAIVMKYMMPATSMSGMKMP
jgi:cytochrome o ubiquinol oxidase subunit II